MNDSGRSDSARVALAYIESLTSRFENAERHINDDINAIEKRLSQLVDLTANVSAIQQQMVSQQQIFVELRAGMRDSLNQIDELVAGIDSRYVNHFEAIKKKVADIAATEARERKTLTARIEAGEEKSRTWLNRIVGGWAVVILMTGFFQFIGVRYIESLQAERTEAKAAVAKLTAQIHDLELRQQALEELRLYAPPAPAAAAGSAVRGY